MAYQVNLYNLIHTITLVAHYMEKTMYDWITLTEKPAAKEIYMIAGWRQWADAGAISSLLPEYLIELTDARKIGEFSPAGFYLFQIPGTHHLLRPVINLEDGYRQSFELPKNEIYYSGDEHKGLLIFLGDEPHMDAERYTEGLLTIARELGVKRIAAVGGVYGSLPYNKDRDVSCIYSLPGMKNELEQYAVRFSNYEGGATIGSFLIHAAEAKNIEAIAFYAFVPAYDFSNVASMPQGLRIENDFKAWYDLMRRFNHMFGTSLDLSELQQQSTELVEAMDTKIDELIDHYPEMQIRDFLEKLETEYNEMTFAPLDDVWERELEDLFKDEE